MPGGNYPLSTAFANSDLMEDDHPEAHNQANGMVNALWSALGGDGLTDPVSPTLALAYLNGAGPAPEDILLDATRGGIRILDAATPIGLDLLLVAKNDGSVEYLKVNASELRSDVDIVSIGDLRSPSSGTRSQQFGSGAVAGGTDALAMGAGASAAGISATAVGHEADAANLNATAVGRLATATGDGASALGKSAAASAGGATALGEDASASNTSATALGKSCSASGASSLACGVSAVAAALNTVAIGVAAQVDDIKSVAVGTGARTKSGNSTALGSGATTELVSSDAVALGTNATAAGGVGSVAIGSGALASGTDAVAIGKGATAVGTNSVAIASATTVDDEFLLGLDTHKVRIPGTVLIEKTLQVDGAAVLGDGLTVEDKAITLKATGLVNCLSTIWNLEHSDADGGRGSAFQFIGETAAGLSHTLGALVCEHDGTGADQRGRVKLWVNTGADGPLPKTMLQLDYTGLMTIAGELALNAGANLTSAKVVTDTTGVGATTRSLTFPDRDVDLADEVIPYSNAGSVGTGATVTLGTADRGMVCVYPGTVFAVAARAAALPGAGQSATVQVHVNGSPVGSAITLDNTAQSATATFSAAVVAGDFVSLVAVSNGTWTAKVVAGTALVRQNITD